MARSPSTRNIPWFQKPGVILIPLILLIILLLAVIFSDHKPDELTTTVDPVNQTINDDADPGLELIQDTLSDISDGITAAVSDSGVFLAAVASPSLTYVKIRSGMRQEEIASIFSKRLAWNAQELNAFYQVPTGLKVNNLEGYYQPGTYLLNKDEGGKELNQKMLTQFEKEIGSRYGTSTKKIVNLDTALKIASIIEREAGGKNDMRLISGIIWNRIFKGMPLQMDATLQYVKGNEEIGWWPKVIPEDKDLDSPYNTYQNKGFPPTPISNVSLTAVEAALNPKKTSCLYYLHDRWRQIHCATTYTEHKKNINRYY